LTFPPHLILSAAFDTVCKSRLLPKLRAAGIRGKALEWLESYLSGGEQSVLWGDTISDTLKILQQGSILGALLNLVLVADFPSALGTVDGDGTDSGGVVAAGYADNMGTWAIGDSLAEVTAELQRLSVTSPGTMDLP
jgi:hypothetical protein